MMVRLKRTSHVTKISNGVDQTTLQVRRVYESPVIFLHALHDGDG